MNTEDGVIVKNCSFDGAKRIKLYVGFLADRVRRMINRPAYEEQGDFRSGRVCVSQIFTLE